MLIYRNDYTENLVRTPEQQQSMMQKWMDWLSKIAAEGKLLDKGSRLNNDGKVLKTSNIITDGPYTESKESIGGFSVIQASSLNEAAEIAKGCPIFTVGGNVEVREVIDMD